MTTFADVGIDPYLEPATLGDWMGANGPRYDDPAFRERVTFIRGLGLRWQRFNLDFPACCRPVSLERMVGAMTWAVAASVAPIALFSVTGFDGHMLTSGLPNDAGLAIYETKLVPVVTALIDAGVRVFESHNEWNGPGVHNQPDSARTARVLAMTHSVVHAVAAQRGVDVMVLPGGTASSAPSSVWFAQSAYARLVADPLGLGLDASAHHAGAYPYDPHTPTNKAQAWNGFYQTEWVNQVVDTQRPGLRTWVTEIPWPTTGPGPHFADEVTAAQRAEVDLLVLADWMNHGIAGPVIVYHGCPDGSPGSDTSAGFGIRRSDGSSKAVCSVLAEFAASATTLHP